MSESKFTCEEVRPPQSERSRELQRLVDLIEDKIALLPPYSYEERIAYRHAVNKIIDQLTEHEGAKFSERNNYSGYAFRLAGIRATCTGSETGSLTNWTAAARRAITATEATLEHEGRPF